MRYPNHAVAIVALSIAIVGLFFTVSEKVQRAKAKLSISERAESRKICLNSCNERTKDILFPQGFENPKCETICTRAYLSQNPNIELHAEPVSPGVRPSGDNRAFILIEAMSYEVGSTGILITVPAGFVTDYASIPRRLWSLFSPHGQYSRAAIVHDYLYWSQLCTRSQADNLFMIAMKESDVPEKTRNYVYQAVSAFGESSWKENRQQRNARMPKVVPMERKDFHPNWTWEKYRDHLMKAGISDPAFIGSDYCALGDSTEIPNPQPNRPETHKTELLKQPSYRIAVRRPKLQ